MPSSRELAKDLSISRITVKSVYEQLITEGYLKSKTGSGTFVSEDLEFFSYKKLKSVMVKPADVEGKLPDRVDRSICPRLQLDTERQRRLDLDCLHLINSQ